MLNAPPTDPTTQGRGTITVSSGAYDAERPNALTCALDRSPFGAANYAKTAVLHAKGLLDVGQVYVNSGPLGTTFTGRIEETMTIGNYTSVVPSLSGRGWIYGVSQYMLDPSDPVPSGFTIGDIRG